MHALEQVGGNRMRAAEVMGIDRRTLYRMAERFGIPLKDDGREELAGDLSLYLLPFSTFPPDSSQAAQPPSNVFTLGMPAFMNSSAARALVASSSQAQ